MFTALFTIDKIQKQPKCLSTDEWIKKGVVYKYNRILLGHKKRKLKKLLSIVLKKAL